MSEIVSKQQHRHAEIYHRGSIKGLCNNYQEGGAEKLEGGHYIKLLPRWGGAQSKVSHLTEGGALSFIQNVNKIKRNKRFSIHAS